MTESKPIVGTVIGDPAGVGPEVVVRSLASGKVHECSRPVLIGSAAAMERAASGLKVDIAFRVIEDCKSARFETNVIDIIDSGAMASDALPLGVDTESAGEATAIWFDEMDHLARSGDIDATVLAPISAESLKMAGKLEKLISPRLGEAYLMLVSGPLRVVHLTDHMPLREVCDVISADYVFKALADMNDAWFSWTGARPRIGVAGLNPHAKGAEEEQSIAPGVELARKRGMKVFGPVSPDSVFRQCVEEKYDMVLAMYHDQGHIALKTWGFSGNSVIMLGPPYLHVSVAHGTAYDIVGKGIADHTMMLNAMCMAGQLAAGKGFPSES